MLGGQLRRIFHDMAFHGFGPSPGLVSSGARFTHAWYSTGVGPTWYITGGGPQVAHNPGGGPQVVHHPGGEPQVVLHRG